MDNMFNSASSFDQQLTGAWLASNSFNENMFKDCPGSIAPALGRADMLPVASAGAADRHRTLAMDEVDTDDVKIDLPSDGSRPAYSRTSSRGAAKKKKKDEGVAFILGGEHDGHYGA